MAAAVSVSRPTVTAALDELRGEGLLVSRQGSGTRVAALAPAPPGPTLVERALGDAAINLAAPVPPVLPPNLDLAVSGADVAALDPAHGYDPVGRRRLRSAMADRWRGVGLDVGPDRVLVTNGAHHGLAVAIGALLDAGDRVLVEHYTFGGILDLLDDRHAAALPLAMDDRGVDPADLDRRLRRGDARVVILQPTVHSPTGRTSTSERVRELAAVLDDHAAMVIADDSLADLHHVDRPDSLGAQCRRAEVVTITSFSKSVWGGFRVGFLTASEQLFPALARQRARRDLGTSPIAQLVVERLLPDVDAVLAERRRSLAERSSTAARALADALPEWEIAEPSGAAMIWCRLPIDDAAAFVNWARRHGVGTLPGSAVRVGRGPDPHLRVATDLEWGIMGPGIDRLADGWRAWRGA